MKTIFIGSFIFLSLFVFVSCAHLSFLCPGDPMTDAEASVVGRKQLTRLCENQNFDKSTFPDSPTYIKYFADEKIWVVDFNGREKFVRFIIDNCGRIETSVGEPERVTTIG